MNTARTNFKGPATPARVLRRRKSGRLKRSENVNKQEVRDRDVGCRFPICPCHRFGLFLEVSHQEHKGMGGDPTGERSAPEKMILVCNVRHKESKFAIDKETIRWDGLTPAGSNGPVSWSIDIGVFSAGMLAAGTWVEIAREESPGRLMPLTGYQLELVMHLGEQLAQKFQNSFRSS